MNANGNLIPIPDNDGQQPPGGIPPKHPNPNAPMKEIQTSFLEHDGKIYEEVYKDGEASFACWDGQNVTYVDSISTPQAIYVPITHPLISTGAISLPQQAQDYSLSLIHI